MLGHGLLDLASRGVPFYVEHSLVPIPQGDFGCTSHKGKINIKLLLDRPMAIVKGGRRQNPQVQACHVVVVVVIVLLQL